MTVDAVDPDLRAKAIESSDDPAGAIQVLLDAATRPFAANPDLRNWIIELVVTASDAVETRVSALVVAPPLSTLARPYRPGPWGGFGRPCAGRSPHKVSSGRTAQAQVAEGSSSVGQSDEH